MVGSSRRSLGIVLEANRVEEKPRVALWDTATGKESNPVIGPEQVQQFTPIHFSLNGKWLAWNARSGIMLAEAANVTEVRHLKLGFGKHAKVFNDFLFTPDDKTLVTWETRHFHLWDVATGERRRDFAVTEDLRLVAISPDGKLLALSGGGASVISILDIATGAAIPAPCGCWIKGSGDKVRVAGKEPLVLPDRRLLPALNAISQFHAQQFAEQDLSYRRFQVFHEVGERRTFISPPRTFEAVASALHALQFLA
jgi:hypothetical protein